MHQEYRSAAELNAVLSLPDISLQAPDAGALKQVWQLQLRLCQSHGLGGVGKRKEVQKHIFPGQHRQRGAEEGFIGVLEQKEKSFLNILKQKCRQYILYSDVDGIHIWKLQINNKKSEVSPVFPDSCITSTASATLELLAVHFITYHHHFRYQEGYLGRR